MWSSDVRLKSELRMQLACKVLLHGVHVGEFSKGPAAVSLGVLTSVGFDLDQYLALPVHLWLCAFWAWEWAR